MAFSSVLLDTLNAVNDQIERRTYGQDHLKLTIHCWENIIRQTRLLLLLKSRVYSNKIPAVYTIEALVRGELSIYHVLAYDSLEFATRVDQAKEHEERCREVYKRRSSNVTGRQASG